MSEEEDLLTAIEETKKRPSEASDDFRFWVETNFC